MSGSTGDLYLVWSHEHAAWWGPGEGGYVGSLARAGRYTREQALRICTRAIPGTAMQLGALPELPVRLEDVETMRSLHRTDYPGIVEAWE